MGGGLYYKKKVRVLRVVEESWAEVEELKSKDVLKVHESMLRCVVPVNGGNAGFGEGSAGLEARRVQEADRRVEGV